jgi:pimeloyl-ACP methyl ester carboxylesterase
MNALAKVLLSLLIGLASPSAMATECVILLHGLARTAGSMSVMEEALQAAGYHVANIDYPSRHHSVAELAPRAVGEGLSQCTAVEATSVHFVTHSMGGILVRYHLRNNRIENLGRVVMLAPPNQGSEVVDNLRDTPGFAMWNGPAGLELGTGENDVPARLGPVDFPVGVIAGTESVNPMLSRLLPSPDDGKVSVARTKVEGMADFVAVSATHTFIMRNEEAIRHTLSFLAKGSFAHDSP